MVIPQLPKVILVPVDYEAQSQEALRLALELARGAKSRVLAVFVWAAPYAPTAIASDELHKAQVDLFDMVRHAAAETMVEFIREQQEAAGDTQLDWFVVSGDPRAKILEVAQEKQADLIVLGTHGHSALRNWALGSVAEHTLRHAECPVLVVPGPRGSA